jgi:hypothetical protein
VQPETYDSTLSCDVEVPPPSQPPETNKLDTTVTLWLILFVFGGGLLALYYGGIGYFPEVTWQDALTYMALMTIIGGSLLVAYSFLLFVPGAIWSEFLIFDQQLYKVLMMGGRRWEPCVWSVSKRIVYPFALFMACCHFLLSLDTDDKALTGFLAVGAAASLAAVAGLLGRDFREGLELAAKTKTAGKDRPADAIPDTRDQHEVDGTLPLTLQCHRVLAGLTHIPLLAAFVAKEIRQVDLGPVFLWGAALCPLVSFAVLLADGWIKRSRPPSSRSAATPPNPPAGEPGTAAGPAPSPIPDKLSLLCRAILAFGSAALLSLAALWFLYRIYRGNAHGVDVGPVPVNLLLLCTLVVIVTNLAVSVLFHKHRRQAFLASVLAALLLLGAGQLLAERGAGLPARIMEEFGFGAESATLVLTEKGGRILSQQSIPVTFEKRTGLPADAAGAGPPVGASTRDGTPARLESPASGKPREDFLLARAAGIKILSRLGSAYLLSFNGRNFTLSKEEVVSWSVADPALSSTTSTSPR